LLPAPELCAMARSSCRYDKKELWKEIKILIECSRPSSDQAGSSWGLLRQSSGTRVTTCNEPALLLRFPD